MTDYKLLGQLVQLRHELNQASAKGFTSCHLYFHAKDVKVKMDRVWDDGTLNISKRVLWFIVYTLGATINYGTSEHFLNYGRTSEHFLIATLVSAIDGELRRGKIERLN